MQGIETVYRHHHAKKRKEDFVLLGDVRGSFLQKHVGEGKRVLDIGCRDGELTKYYAVGNDVVGVDIDAKALARAKEKLGIETVHVDLNGDWGELKGRVFDVVVAAEIIEHLYYPEVVLEKIKKVLSSEGVLLGSVPHAFSLQNRLRLLLGKKKNTPLEDPTHINHFTYIEWRDLLNEQFSSVEVEGIGKPVLANYLPGLFAHSLLFKAKI